jgi:hypothetical protein
VNCLIVALNFRETDNEEKGTRKAATEALGESSVNRPLDVKNWQAKAISVDRSPNLESAGSDATHARSTTRPSSGYAWAYCWIRVALVFFQYAWSAHEELLLRKLLFNLCIKRGKAGADVLVDVEECRRKVDGRPL